MESLLLFGSTGTIGQCIQKKFSDENWQVTAVKRKAPVSGDDVIYNDKEIKFPDAHSQFNAVCWAGGLNFNDDIVAFDETKHLAMYEANCLFVIRTLHQLIDKNKLAPNAKLCIIGSIWQTIARSNKLSYCVTKSALTGLVHSLASDLGQDNILVNCIMPGALDSEMTRKNLTEAQIQKISAYTPYQRLPSLDSVSDLAFFLCGSHNTSITSQCIAVDLGFSYAKVI